MAAKLYRSLLICIFCTLTLTALAQTKINKPDSVDKEAGLEVQLNYLSNSIFMGRADSVRTSVISPQIKYTFSPGIYLSGGIDLIPGRKKNKLDGGNITLGWDFDVTDDLSGGLSYSKLFYSATSTQVFSSVSNTFNGNLTYNINDIISPTISADYNINKQGVAGDIFINFGISHDIILGSNDELLLSPTIEANTGTQNFYNEYLVYRKRKNVQAPAAAVSLVQAYQAQLSQYKLLDYEFSMPVEYTVGRFEFEFTPTYALAENRFISSAILKALEPTGQNGVFFFELGALLKFQ